MFDVLAVSGSWDERMIEYVDHLHEHFVVPVQIKNGRYTAPTEPGIGAEILAESIAEFTYPTGVAWAESSPPA
jgi:L-fuconate dehydratase